MPRRRAAAGARRRVDAMTAMRSTVGVAGLGGAASAAVSLVGGDRGARDGTQGTGAAARLEVGCANLGRKMPEVVKWGDAGFKREQMVAGCGVVEGKRGKALRKKRRMTEREALRELARMGLDGGVAVVESAGTDACASGSLASGGDVRGSNLCVYLTAWPSPGGDAGRGGGGLSRGTCEALTVATVDVCDQAHGVRDHESTLVCAKDLVATRRGARATPRRYPRSQMTSRGVAFDSAFDELHERLHRLRGVDGFGVRGIGSVSSFEQIRMAASEARRRGTRLVDVARQQLKVKNERGEFVPEPSMGDSAEAVEAYALAQIELHRRGKYSGGEE